MVKFARFEYNKKTYEGLADADGIEDYPAASCRESSP